MPGRFMCNRQSTVAVHTVEKRASRSRAIRAQIRAGWSWGELLDENVRWQPSFGGLGFGLEIADIPAMHTSELTRATYTPPTDAPASFMDIEITREHLLSGELHQRFDPIAFPRVGVKYTGTDADGVAVPAPARTVTG